MIDAASLVTIASTGMVGLGIVSTAMLRGWAGWLEVKRLQIEDGRRRAPPSPSAVAGEITVLKERVRRLEAIASGVDF
ncbi:MAG: hypothetical protein M3N39_06430 [Pseudomonadota bacterium]|nr:hypothetical protein [Pseudomonadota bacterium]